MSAPSAVLENISKDSRPCRSYPVLEGDVGLTEETPDRHKERFGWKGLFFVIIGLLFLAFAVILMVNIIGHPGGASARVVRQAIPCDGTCG
jgi:hypothetical protein